MNGKGGKCESNPIVLEAGCGQAEERVPDGWGGSVNKVHSVSVELADPKADVSAEGGVSVKGIVGWVFCS